MQEERRWPEEYDPDGMMPDLMERTVSGIFDRRADAESAVAELLKAGWPYQSVSMVKAPPGTPPALDAGGTRSNRGLLVGAAAGAAIGALIGLLLDLVLPIGRAFPVLPSTSLTAAILIALACAIMGALLGSFLGLGVFRRHVVDYGAALQHGGYLVQVNAPDPSSADRVCNLLTRRGARSVNAFNASL